MKVHPLCIDSTPSSGASHGVGVWLWQHETLQRTHMMRRCSRFCWFSLFYFHKIHSYPLTLTAPCFFGFRSWRCCLGNWIVWRLSGFLWQCYCSLCLWSLFCCHMQHPVLITCVQLFKTSCCMCWWEEKETALTNARYLLQHSQGSAVLIFPKHSICSLLLLNLSLNLSTDQKSNEI